MRIVDGIEVPETIGEARQMNYNQLQKACEVFNENGISAEDIKKQWDTRFWNGYHACLDMVLSIIDSVDSNRLPSIESVRDEIVETVELYKKEDGI